MVAPRSRDAYHIQQTRLVEVHTASLLGGSDDGFWWRCRDRRSGSSRHIVVMPVWMGDMMIQESLEVMQRARQMLLFLAIYRAGRRSYAVRCRWYSGHVRH